MQFYIKSFVLFFILLLTTNVFASECVSTIDAEFSNDGLSVVTSSDKGLSNVVLAFTDGSEQKFEVKSNDTYSQEYTGTGSNTGKQLEGVWIKSGCEKSGDGSGYGEYIPACSNENSVSLRGDVRLLEPLQGKRDGNFYIDVERFGTLKSCDITVSLSTRDGASGFNTASAGSDYSSFSESITILPGQDNRQIKIDIFSDGEMSEGTEAFSLEIISAENAEIGNDSVIGIIDEIQF